jgi:hypothetical protein
MQGESNQVKFTPSATEPVLLIEIEIEKQVGLLNSHVASKYDLSKIA